MSMAGGGRWPVTGYIGGGCALVFLVLAGFGLWLTLARIDGAVMAMGSLSATDQPQIVQHPVAGVVAESHVQTGQPVATGDLLFRLDGASLLAEQQAVHRQGLLLLAERARHMAECCDLPLRFAPDLTGAGDPQAAAAMTEQQRLFAANAEIASLTARQHSAQQQQLHSRITGLTAQHGALLTQEALVARELADLQALVQRGLAETGRMTAAARQHAELAGRAAVISAEITQARAQSDEGTAAAALRTASLRAQALHRLHEIAVLETDLKARQQALAQQLAQLEIHAPMAGIVHDLRVTTPRAVIVAGQPLLTLVPQDQVFRVRADLPARDIDQVQIGQSAVLRLSTQSQRQAPGLRGQVTQVSADIFRDPAGGRAYYRAEISIDPASLATLPAEVRLVSGMPVEIFLQTGTRRAISYLVSPLTDYFTRAFRDQ